MRKKRHSDGKFRGSHQASEISIRSNRARWVETEVLKRKTLGFTFHAIAQQMTEVGRGQAQPLVEFPPGITFPPHYSISAVACWRACQKALMRGPRLRAQEMRDIDTDRLEEGILAAQKAIKQGDSAALGNLARLITTRARLNGYLAPQQVELAGKSGRPVEIKSSDDIEVAQMLERLTREEAIEFLRLFNKAKGIETEATNQELDGRMCDEEDNAKQIKE